MVLQRNSFHYMNCIILPCFILVILSYTTVWISIHRRDLRLYINLFSFLCLLHMYYTSTCVILLTHYFKALDVFVIISICFASLSIIESFIVDYLCNLDEQDFHLRKTAFKWEYSKIICYIELGIRFSFPVMYAFIILLYCIAYLN